MRSWVSCAVCTGALQSKSCSEEGDHGFGGEEHLHSEQSRIKVRQTNDQRWTSVNTDCLFILLFWQTLQREEVLQWRGGDTSTALPSFSSQMVIICILKNQEKKGYLVVSGVSPVAEYWLQRVNAVVSAGDTAGLWQKLSEGRERLISSSTCINKHLRMFLSSNSMLVAVGDLYFLLKYSCNILNKIEAACSWFVACRNWV